MQNISDQELVAVRASTSTVLMGYKFGDAHLVSSLSCIDLLISCISFYNDKKMKLILSKGHAACALYSVYAEFGKIPFLDLLKFNQEGSSLGIHVSSHLLAEVTLSTGSLGHGLSVGSGIAKGAKLNKKDQTCIVILGDGETNEGSIWEAAMIASAQELDNLIAIIDMNGVQSVAQTHEVIGQGSMQKKFEAFGWHVIMVDGHNLNQLETAFKESLGIEGKPIAIIADTMANPRVPSMQNGVVWHYRKPNQEDLDLALLELDSYRKCPDIVEVFL